MDNILRFVPRSVACCHCLYLSDLYVDRSRMFSVLRLRDLNIRMLNARPNQPGETGYLSIPDHLQLSLPRYAPATRLHEDLYLSVAADNLLDRGYDVANILLSHVFGQTQGSMPPLSPLLPLYPYPYILDIKCLSLLESKVE